VATSPEHQGQGLGSMLLKAVCEDADARGEWCVLEKGLYGVWYVKFGGRAI